MHTVQVVCVVGGMFSSFCMRADSPGPGIVLSPRDLQLSLPQHCTTADLYSDDMFCNGVFVNVLCNSLLRGGICTAIDHTGG